MGLLQAWERNQYVVNRFKGEIFCSGYGIWIDYRVNPEGHRRLFEIMERCDGERTVADIADELGISFQAVWEVVALLEEKELVYFSRTPRANYPSESLSYGPVCFRKTSIESRPLAGTPGRNCPALES